MKDQVEILLPTAAPRTFDYRVPEGLHLALGDIVRVPIGKRQSLGVVWGAGKAEIAPEKLKSVLAKSEGLPCLSAEFRTFIDWAAWYNCVPKGMVLKMVLPLIDLEKIGRVALPTNAVDPTRLMLAALSPAQQQAASTLEETLHNGFSVTLLDGVTGSGKTEVYFDAIAEILRHSPDAQCLVLLPEIALSVQWLQRFEARFGMLPVVWHSNISPAKRRVSWQAIARGEARIVVGARSALFLPYVKLKLLVIDEEHDGSYKQEDGVHYHARDMAVARARHAGIPVVLVSATPSLETIHNVRMGRFKEVSLPTRHAEALLPHIHLLDMRKEVMERGAFISGTLRKAIQDAINQGHQAMLFLNRRGYAPLVLCRTCGHRFQCLECTAWMVLHRGRGSEVRGQEKKTNTLTPDPRSPAPSLQCHHCGYKMPLPKSCPECKSEDSLHACGPGVERLYEEITMLMPGARIATLASDSTQSHSELTHIIEAMGRKDIDILIGTQMIAKGHHFADLTVVGVVDADLGLMGGDLRAAEKTYQLLHQISGRAGREQLAGHVYLQSYTPEHPVMKALCSGERDAFFAAELQSRENAHMPPFSRLAALIVEGFKETEVIQVAKQLAQVTSHHTSITFYGPAPAPLFMLRGRYRFRLLLKADRNINLPDFVRAWVEAVKTPASVRVKIDMDPMSFM